MKPHIFVILQGGGGGGGPDPLLPRWICTWVFTNSWLYLKKFVPFTAIMLSLLFIQDILYSKTCVKRLFSKRPKICFQDQLSLTAGQLYCRKLEGEHSAILLTFIRRPFVIKIFALSIFEWALYTGYTVFVNK